MDFLAPILDELISSTSRLDGLILSTSVCLLLAIFIFIIIMVLSFRGKPNFDDYWFKVFDTRDFTDPRLHFRLDCLGFLLHKGSLRRGRKLDLCSKSLRDDLMRSKTICQLLKIKNANIYVGMIDAKICSHHFEESTPFQFVVVDTRRMETTLTMDEYVLIYLLPKNWKHSRPNMDPQFVESYVDRWLSKSLVLKQIYQGFAANSAAHVTMTIDVDYLFADFFHENPAILSSQIKMLKSGCHLIIGKPGTGKTLLLRKFQAMVAQAVGPSQKALRFPSLEFKSGNYQYVFDEFEKGCLAHLNRIQDQKCVCPPTSTTVCTCLIPKAVLINEAINFFEELLKTKSNVIFVVNSIEEILTLLKFLGLKHLIAPLFRHGRLYPKRISSSGSPRDILKFYAPNLTPRQVTTIVSTFDQMEREGCKVTASTYFDFLNSVGYSTCYTTFPYSPNLNFKPTDAVIANVLDRYKEDGDKKILDALKKFSGECVIDA